MRTSRRSVRPLLPTPSSSKRMRNFCFRTLFTPPPTGSTVSAAPPSAAPAPPRPSRRPTFPASSTTLPLAPTLSWPAMLSLTRRSLSSPRRPSVDLPRAPRTPRPPSTWAATSVCRACAATPSPTWPSALRVSPGTARTSSPPRFSTCSWVAVTHSAPADPARACSPDSSWFAPTHLATSRPLLLAPPSHFSSPRHPFSPHAPPHVAAERP
mmetsp:Transcript_1684/g.4794  ORF Transcript_1684/g.4794 Transcript_1684/m.4794 type:complete len:211 (-) Transcript_1684:454-1086(-)